MSRAKYLPVLFLLCAAAAAQAGYDVAPVRPAMDALAAAK